MGCLKLNVDVCVYCVQEEGPQLSSEPKFHDVIKVEHRPRLVNPL